MTEKDIVDMLNGYAKDPDVQKQMGVSRYAEKDIATLASKLASAIQSEYLSSRRTRGHDLAMPSIQTKKDKDGSLRATLRYSNASLKRPSLYRDKSYRHPINENGAYDIIGLLTQGYQHVYPGPVYGYWKGHGKVTAPKRRAPEAFVSRAIEKFKNTYGVEVHYPREWGGDI